MQAIADVLEVKRVRVSAGGQTDLAGCPYRRPGSRSHVAAVN
jgi:hypothetical protein